MVRIRIGAPLTLLIAAGCVGCTYFPGTALLGMGGPLGSLLLPWTWVQLLTWPLVHANTAHLLGNMMLFLLLAPNLERKQGGMGFAHLLGGACGLMLGLFGQGQPAKANHPSP